MSTGKIRVSLFYKISSIRQRQMISNFCSQYASFVGLDKLLSRNSVVISCGFDSQSRWIFPTSHKDITTFSWWLDLVLDPIFQSSSCSQYKNDLEFLTQDHHPQQPFQREIAAKTTYKMRGLRLWVDEMGVWGGGKEINLSLGKEVTYTFISLNQWWIVGTMVWRHS